MSSRQIVIALTVVSGILAGAAVGQPMPKRGDYLTLKFPEGLLQEEKSRWRASVRVANISRSPSGLLSISGKETWHPPRRLQSYSITKVAFDPKCNCTEVDLSDFLSIIRLRFNGIALAELPGLLSNVAALGKADETDALAYRDAIRAQAATEMFVEELASITDEGRRLLIAAVNPMPEVVLSGRIGLVTYKNNKYVHLDLGESDTVYNTLKLNQGARTSRVVNEHVLPLVKIALPHVERLPGVAGVRVSTKIFSKSFAEEYATPTAENLDLYITTDAIRKFADADTTSQQMIDSSVVLLNDNRIQVNLTQ